ncbi:LysR substrate-binding domain-containing protein [Albimonas sp. CAU 1670]|uniref:LysR family transcriptional regulator n=1 Tax=Albimonas sp. CAU 1670 TaxID=3032599 RepID=UPI0023DCB7C1|nr:LysR substrate-binding domain-containing protein [Albimonas sp. CAU 1670]MDF2234828.1 LysR substrate-binding domain-containing protein [Albimonas sp. CAU 1670]
MPSLAALRAFEAAARLGSFKDAAEALAITPTAVSHHIRGLEQRLDVPLFTRETRAVHLTEAGRRLSRRLTAAFGEIEAALDEVETAEHVLRVSTTPAFAALWLAPRLHAFQGAHPEIRVQVDTGTEAVDLHRDRQVDVAIRYGAGAPAGLHAVPLGDEAFGLYGAPDHVAGIGEIGAATVLATEWRQARLAPVAPADWLEAFAPGARPTMRWFDQEHHAVQCAIAGQGLAFLSDVLASDMEGRGLLARHREDAAVPGLRYTLLTLPERRRTRKIALFARWIERAFAG